LIFIAKLRFPCNVNLLIDQSFANYFQSCKCSGSVTEKWRR